MKSLFYKESLVLKLDISCCLWSFFTFNGFLYNRNACQIKRLRNHLSHKWIFNANIGALVPFMVFYITFMYAQ